MSTWCPYVRWCEMTAAFWLVKSRGIGLRNRSALVHKWVVSTKRITHEEISRSPQADTRVLAWERLGIQDQRNAKQITHWNPSHDELASTKQETQSRGAKTPSLEGFKMCNSQTSQQRSPSQQWELHLRCPLPEDQHSSGYDKEHTCGAPGVARTRSRKYDTHESKTRRPHGTQRTHRNRVQTGWSFHYRCCPRPQCGPGCVCSLLQRSSSSRGRCASGL